METDLSHFPASTPEKLNRDDPRHALLARDVASRLSRVCGHLSREEFDQLVHDICRVKLRWGPPRSPSLLDD
jgi:hypothetical protein